MKNSSTVFATASICKNKWRQCRVQELYPSFDVNIFFSSQPLSLLALKRPSDVFAAVACRELCKSRKQLPHSDPTNLCNMCCACLTRLCIVKLTEGENNDAVDQTCLPAGGQMLLRQWTPSRRHGKDEAGRLLERP